MVPGSHGGEAALLIGKLKMVDTKGRTKEEENDPVQELQYQTTHSDWPIVLAVVYTTKLVFYERNKSCKEEEESYFSVDEKWLDDCGEKTEEVVRAILDAIWAKIVCRVTFAVSEIASSFLNYVWSDLVHIMKMIDINFIIYCGTEV